MPSAKSRTLCASAAGPPFSGATSRWLKFPDGRKVSDLIALDLWHFWPCVIVNENKWPSHHPCPRKGTVCVIGERLWKQQDQSILGTIVILFKCCKSHFLASAVLVEKQCLSGSSPRHTKMSQKGLNARRKQNCGGNPTQKLHHHSLVAQSQRVETHGTWSVKLWAAFHHESYCFVPTYWSHAKQCCLHLCERQTDCSETVFLWVKSCKENLRSLSDTAQHFMLWVNVDGQTLILRDFLGCVILEHLVWRQKILWGSSLAHILHKVAHNNMWLNSLQALSVWHWKFAEICAVAGAKCEVMSSLAMDTPFEVPSWKDRHTDQTLFSIWVLRGCASFGCGANPVPFPSYLWTSTFACCDTHEFHSFH